MKQTVSDWIIDQLKSKGSVSRNDSLRYAITNRLGAYIKAMVEVGYKFDSRKSKNGIEVLHGRYVKTKKGRDYVYQIISFPKKVKKI